MDSVGAFVPLVLIIGAFYLLILRPSRNRAKAQQRLVQELAPGARVMTTSGLFAVVAAVEDDGVLLEVAPGVRMRWTKAAVARILPESGDDDGAPGQALADGEAQAESATEPPVRLAKGESDEAGSTPGSDGADRPT